MLTFGVMMPLPTTHSVNAALLVCQILGSRRLTQPERRTAYGTIPLGGIYRHQDLEDAERWLLEAGFAAHVGAYLVLQESVAHLATADPATASRLLLLGLLDSQRPSWMRLTQDSELAWEMVPISDMRSIEGVFPDPATREAALLHLARKFDDELNREIGAMGEQAVLQACEQTLVASGRADLVADVVQVSAVSDELGYDIVSPNLAGGLVRIEVKTSASRRTGFFLSRNEADTALQDQGWALVLCCAKIDGSVEIAGWCGGDVLGPMLPTDAGGRWVTARVSLPDSAINPGLPL